MPIAPGVPSEQYAFILFIVLATLLGLYEVIGRDLFIVNWGVFRKSQPISAFPYECRRIIAPGLEACEDMWLSERTRTLFLACSDPLSRKDWMPNIGRLNASGRALNDRIIALDLDKPKGTGFEYQALQTPDYTGVNGDGKLHLVGITGIDREDYVELYLINARPSINTTTGEFLDNEKVGGNSTIEHFRVDPQENEMQHVKTFAHTQIATPNNVAPTGDGSFYFTNDHGLHKTGIWHQLSPVIKDGDVSFCDKNGVCKRVAGGYPFRGYSFPNGLFLGKDERLYVPSSGSGNVVVYTTKPDGSIKERTKIKILVGLDNISQDANGDLWVVGFPQVDIMMGSFDDPLNAPTSPATVFRIKRRGEDYEVAKMLEDSEGAVLPGATTAVHDVKTGRVFVSGIVSSFITVCEWKEDFTSQHKRVKDEGHSEL